MKGGYDNQSFLMTRALMTKILAFDTATAACSAALWLDGEIHQQFEVAPRRHGELLLPMIDRLLKEAGLRLSDCDAVAFGCGPGSFMGLRIAAGVAQGLAFGANIPVLPVPTLQALAQTAYWETQCHTILVGWDARIHQIYWGIYSVEENYMCPLIEDRLSTPIEVTLRDKDKPCLAAGNAWSVYARALPKIIAELPQSQQEYYPTAKAIAFLGAHFLEQGKAIEPQVIELSYLRNKVAEKPK